MCRWHQWGAFSPEASPINLLYYFILPIVIYYLKALRVTTQSTVSNMSFYDEIEIEDMTYHPETNLFTYPCPCGDQFEILLQDLQDGEEVAVCPSCSLQIKVIFDAVSCASRWNIGYAELTVHYAGDFAS